MRCYALDVGRKAIRIALYGFEDDEPVFRLESRCVAKADLTSLWDTLTVWREYYAGREDEEVVVGCRSDPWPPNLDEQLEEAGFTLHWIEDNDELRLAVNYLGSLQENPVFMRAAVMAHWPVIAGECDHDGIAMEVQYNLLRHKLMDLECSLAIHGRLPCPGHLTLWCPRCDHEPNCPDDELPSPDELEAFSSLQDIP